MPSDASTASWVAIAAAIHAVDVSHLRELPLLDAQRQLQHLHLQYQSQETPRPVFELAFRWLRAHLPPAVTPALVHGDYRHGNLIIGPQGVLAVLDWESGVVEGVPALDLFYYLAHASFEVDGANSHDERVASYRAQRDPGTQTGAVRNDCLIRYADALKLPLDRLRPLAVLVWLIHAPSDFSHAAADAGGTRRGPRGRPIAVA